MTEHEMAKFWEDAAGFFEVMTALGRPYAAKARETAAMLRRVPTRAQKMEALRYAESCGESIAVGLDASEDEMPSYVVEAGHYARRALRLLGLDDQETP